MADSPVNGFASGAPVVASDILYLARSPFAVGDDRKCTAQNIRDFVLRSGAASPDGVEPGPIRSIYIQSTLGFFAIWMNTNNLTAWKILQGSGALDPNGLFPGVMGALFSQIPGDGSAVLWQNTTGAMVWI